MTKHLLLPTGKSPNYARGGMRKPGNIPRGNQVQTCIRNPPEGTLKILNLHGLATYLHQSFDGKVPYFNDNCYDIHDFILDSVEMWVYGRAIQGLPYSEVEYAIMDALYIDSVGPCDAGVSHDAKWDSKMRTAQARREVNDILRTCGLAQNDPSREYDYTLDLSMSLWIVTKNQSLL